MAARSSISSSEKSFPARGIPWGLLGAAALVLLLELWLHQLPVSSLLGYGSGMAVYSEIKHTIEARGVADIAVLGTSRGRESIVAPLMKEMAERQLGREVAVANYSCAGGLADEMLQITRLMLESEMSPAMVLYFVSPSLLVQDSRWQRLDVLGVYTARFRVRSGQTALALLGRPFWDFRNWLEDHYLTYRYRYRFRHLITSGLRRRKPVSAVQGEYTTWQLYAAHRSLESHPVSVQRIRVYATRLLDEDGRYTIKEHQLAALAETVRLCQAHDVPIVVFEAPLSEDLAAQMPEQLKTTFSGALVGLLQDFGLKPLTMDDIEAGLTRADFREQSHLNRSGGEKVTRAVMERVVVPLFKESAIPRRM